MIAILWFIWVILKMNVNVCTHMSYWVHHESKCMWESWCKEYICFSQHQLNDVQQVFGYSPFMSLRPILILFSYLFQSLPSILFPRSFQVKILCYFFISAKLCYPLWFISTLVPLNFHHSHWIWLILPPPPPRQKTCFCFESNPLPSLVTFVVVLKFWQWEGIKALAALCYSHMPRLN
jgi:hypothetical protein